MCRTSSVSGLDELVVVVVDDDVVVVEMLPVEALLGQLSSPEIRSDHFCSNKIS